MLTRNYNVIALMSGTSLDGIDLIYAKYSYIDKWSFKIYHHKTYNYNSKWINVLGGLTSKSLNDLKLIDEDYSEYLGNVILSFIKENSIKTIDFIASHGHTALHQPQKKLTYQIGNLQKIADTLNLKVICDFRTQDVKLGGQGAPLVPIGDKLLFNEYKYCLNLGGFANISYEETNKRVAYDICPVNIVLNHYAKHVGYDYDDKGQLASKGKINETLLQDLNDLSYYSMRIPKSLGLEWVQKEVFPLIDNYKLNIKDILRTFVAHAAFQVANTLKGKKDSKMLITGGGAYNDFLINTIKSISKVDVVIPSRAIIEYKEALIFGLLGVLKEENRVNCLSSVTGAERDHSSGKILLPSNEKH